MTTTPIMNDVVELLQGAADFEADTLSSLVKGWITEQGLGFGKVMQPLRLSLVGALQGPDIFVIAEMLGKEETITRIQYVIKTLTKE